MDLLQAYTDLERELEGVISVLESPGLPASTIEAGLARVTQSFTVLRAHAGELEALDAESRELVRAAAARTRRLHGVVQSQVACEFDALRQKIASARDRREQLESLGRLRAGATSGSSCDVTG